MRRKEMNLTLSETIEALRTCEKFDGDLMKHAADLILRMRVQIGTLNAKLTPMACTHEESKVEDYTCPICKNVVSTREKWGESIFFIVPKYCKFCGQRICKEEELNEETLYLNAYVRPESDGD